MNVTLKNVWLNLENEVKILV